MTSSVEKKAQNRRYYENNREKVKAAYSRWREQNPEKVKARNRRYYGNNIEKLKAASNRWAKQNPEKAREKRRRRRALKRNALGWMPPYPEGILFGDQDGLCTYCEVDLVGTGWHLEHRVPLSRGGKHDWDNVCLSCPPCNLSKHMQTDLEFK